MGIGISRPRTGLTTSELKLFADETHFTADQVLSIFHHFRQLSAIGEDDGVIDLGEFCCAIGMDGSNELSRQIFRVFDTNGDGVLNFREYLNGLSVLGLGSLDEKVKLAFRIYDIDGDGQISREELAQLVEASLQGHGSTRRVVNSASLIDETFRQADVNHNGFIDFSEFRQLAVRQPAMLASLTVEPQRLAHITGGGGEATREVTELRLGRSDTGMDTLGQQEEITPME